mmetsp:Transcript_5104/g.9974  ORF Transcript_5104/g.9974 Transcript_5104/m.9974 type:complete len:261 (+) Transcript_5104:151-933(+)
MRALAIIALSSFWATISSTGATSSCSPYSTLREAIRSALQQSNPTFSTIFSPSKLEQESFVGPVEPVFRFVKFWTNVGPIVLHYKFTEVWFKVFNIDLSVRHESWEALHEKYAPASLQFILDLKGLFVKIGQVMSSRADFVPIQYVDSFNMLQDSVPSWESGRVKEIVRESLRNNQKVNFEEVFEEFGEVLGSPSIGQVHRAKLTPQYGGENVAVKVMHPNARTKFRNDFKVFRSFCKVALPGWDPILKELELQMMTEFN